MKRLRAIIISVITVISLMAPMASYAAGDPNIGAGGGGMGDGSDQYYWNETYDGARLTLVRSDTGAIASPSIDVTNRDTSIIQVHFGKNSKKAYTDGHALSLAVSEYEAFTPSSPLPKIINCALIPANIDSIKSYFCDESVLRWFAGKISMDFDTMIGGSYKLMVEPVAYIVYGGVWMAMTATEAALYNQQVGGMLRTWFGSLSHKNLPLALFLERDEMGYSAWGGGRDVFVDDATIISTLGIGLVSFTDEPIPAPLPVPDYTYRTDTDVITAVYVTGGYADPDNPVTVSFNIRGTVYNVSNVYYPENASQIVWVRWHTPSSPMQITIGVSAGATVSDSSIVCNIVDLSENPPPNPVADDRNDSYNPGLAVMPANPELTGTTWSVWRCTWHENWEWVADWNWIETECTEECDEDCDGSHGYWHDDGEWEDHGWWDYHQDYYWASLSASTIVTPDTLDPTAYGDTIKSGYGINQTLTTSASGNNYGAITGAQNAQSWFPEFYYQTYWRNLERMTSGYNITMQFKPNQYSTYNNRTHFTPVWMKNGNYTVYTYVFDMWTPNGMLSTSCQDGVSINGALWDDWHIAPENPD